MKKNRFTIIKDFEKRNDDFDVEKTHRQIIDDNHYFKLKEFVKIKV